MMVRSNVVPTTTEIVITVSWQVCMYIRMRNNANVL